MPPRTSDKDSIDLPAFERMLLNEEIPSSCIFLGDNEFDKGEALDAAIERCVEPATRAFNFDAFHGDEATAESVANAVMGAPMMSTTRTVLMRAVDKASNGVLTALSDAPPSTRLILTATKLDGRRPKHRDLREKSCVVQCDVPYENNLPTWVRRRADKAGKKIDGRAAALLVECVGRDVGRLADEIAKLDLFVGAVPEITVEDVEKVVGITREDTVFALMDALGEGHTAEAVAVVGRMVDAGSSAIYLVGRIVNYMNTLLDAADRLRLKGVAGLEESLGRSRVFLVKKYRRQVKALGMLRIRRGLGLALAAESNLKRGLGDPSVTLDALIVALAASVEPLAAVKSQL
jgi:DNA polymerase-3 subunit delta